MKRTLALAAALLALTAPITAQAHRSWLAPSSTVLSGNEAWVGFDAGISSGVFIPDYVAMRLDGLVVTGPDGSSLQVENRNRARYRSSFDLHLATSGTYRIANILASINAAYTLDGEQRRWRGPATDYPAALPEGASNIQATRTDSRIETFVTLNNPSDTALASPPAGLAMVPITHPNDLVSGEAATFRLVQDGVAVTGLEVTVVRGGSRYRDNPEEQILTTSADGSFTVIWPEAGLYWLNASVRTPAQGETLASIANYVAVLEVLP